MSESVDETNVDSNDDVPVIEEGTDTIEVGVIEEQDPLEAALTRADTAEKEIAYKEAEIQNLRKRYLNEKSELIQYGSMGLARKMLSVLADVDRAMNNISDDDQSPLAQGLRLLRNKMWHEISGDGVSAIEAKGKKFDPAKMEAITTIPASDDFPGGTVVDVIEAGYMYKQKVLIAARVVVASDD
ncbi:MAG: nucleotide exchange factor GrpE [Candidatus Thermoplasmatota archaeon]|nr:nucleotide exchange factor GrpE [Candidatus Thermoplasmatota archaeon]MEC8242470.1 nucleotide exchange factor GrpE [Candidatus Thermoplasmatota archaeon]MEC8312509.1 nucleotide exchange factor GrpE [Candidatus Thermoplasmatota archaeon]